MAEKNLQTQSQVLSQTQTQQLSPQQVLEARILQLTAVELEERVRGEVQENPALEESMDYDNDDIPLSDEDADNEEWSDSQERDDRAADFLSEDDMPDYYRDPSSGRSAETQAAEIPFSDTVSFYDVLAEQLGEHELSERQRQIALYLIGSLDDSGLLLKPIDDLCTELAVNEFIYVDQTEIEQVLGIIQQFDPAGIGARNLSECLLLQLERKDDSPARSLAVRIIKECFDDLTHLRYERMSQRLEIPDFEINAALDVISHLNPRPGNALGESEGRGARQVIPDYIIETYDGTVQFSLNNLNVPELRVSKSFSETLDARMKSGDSVVSQEALFIRRKLEAAQGFIDAIRKREATMTRTMQVIIDLQTEYFLSGDEGKLRPMILKDVAERTGYDISTISRATSGKYAETDFGIIELRRLFTDGVMGADGVEVSVREIHRIIREAVDGEDHNEPLTDDSISEILGSRGYNVARRTVAKYREQLGIPVSRLRR